MKLSALIKIANHNLFRAKLRTFLTVMAIFVGSFTLTLTNGMGDGMRDYVENQVKNLEGNNILFVRKKLPAESEEGAKAGEPLEYKEITQDQAGDTIDPNSLIVPLAQMKTIAGEMPDVKSITPSYFIEGEFIMLDGTKKYQLELGTLSEGVTQKTEAGKMIDGANQIIFPLSLARAFDEDINRLIGKTVTIAYKVGQNGELRNLPLKIVGVATKGFMANYNSFIDIETAKRIYNEQQSQNPNFNKFQRFTFQLNSSDDATIAAVKNNLDEKGFSADTFADQKKRTYDGIGIFQIGLNLFAFIALLAASFGIINTLIIAVLERTKEIGLQKVLGMGRGKIFMRFSVESVLIGFWGAVFGIASGIVIGTAANYFLARAFLESFEGYSIFVFTPWAILFVLVLVCLIAFGAGVMPAFRASRLNPIEALRYE